MPNLNYNTRKKLTKYLLNNVEENGVVDIINKNIDGIERYGSIGKEIEDCSNLICKINLQCANCITHEDIGEEFSEKIMNLLSKIFYDEISFQQFINPNNDEEEYDGEIMNDYISSSISYYTNNISYLFERLTDMFDHIYGRELICQIDMLLEWELTDLVELFDIDGDLQDNNIDNFIRGYRVSDARKITNRKLHNPNIIRVYIKVLKTLSDLLSDTMDDDYMQDIDINNCAEYGRVNIENYKTYWNLHITTLMKIFLIYPDTD